MNITEDERIDFLFNKNLKIVQSDRVFSFSLDAVLLAKFVHVPIQKGKLIDLCSGNGAIALMLSQRTKGNLTAVEIQQRLHEMAEKSVALNGLKDRIHLICGKIEDIPTQLGSGQFDVVTCNPPYFSTPPTSDLNENVHFQIARHEVTTTLEEVVQTSSRLLKQGGKAGFVHRPERLPAIMTLMREHRLEPKRVKFIHPKAGKNANIVLIEGRKDGKPNLTILPPLTVYDKDDQYTEDLKEICYGE